MITRVIVVRHGETRWNAEARIQGHGDSALSPTGEAQAAAIARRLEGEPIDRFFASDLGRARQTAAAIAARTGHAVDHDARFRERHYGIAEGLTYDEVAERYPDVFSRVRAIDPDYAVPGGESRRAFHARVSAAFEALAREHAGRRLLVVCHGGVLGSLYRHALGIALEEPRAIPIPNAAYNELRHEGGRWSVDAWADIAHLEAVAALDEP